ncbi:unnamed protein product [Closterium sp. NIES-53]
MPRPAPSPFERKPRSAEEENPLAGLGVRASASPKSGAVMAPSSGALSRRRPSPNQNNAMFEFDPELVAAFQRNMMFFRRVFSLDTFLRPLPAPVAQSIARSFGFFTSIFTQFVDPKGIKNAQKAMGIRKDDSRIEHRDDIDYTDDTVPREGVVPTSSTTAAAIMLTFDDQGLNDVENSRDYMAAVAGWGDTANMPTDDGIWGADEPDETTWGETSTERDTRLLAEAGQRVADMEILDSGRLVGVEHIPAASDQESGELVLAPGEYVDVEVRVPPPNLTRYVAPAFDQIRSDGHQLLLSFFANAEYYLRAQGDKATGETWHKRLGHPSQSTLNNTIKAAVLDKNSLLLPSGLELKPVNRPAPCTICPAANLSHEPFPTHFPGAEDFLLMDKVYSDILNLPADGFNGERYVITFTDASTRYVWTGNMTNRFLAFTAFRTWLPLAERESDTQLKSFQSDGAGEYRSTEFTAYLQERGKDDCFRCLTLINRVA